MAAYSIVIEENGRAANVKGFGCREAYESLRGRNPRAAAAALWRFGLQGCASASLSGGLMLRAWSWRATNLGRMEVFAASEMGGVVTGDPGGPVLAPSAHGVAGRRGSASARADGPCGVTAGSSRRASTPEAVARGVGSSARSAR